MSSWRYYNGLIEDVRKRLVAYDENNPDFVEEMKQFLYNPWLYMKDYNWSHRKKVQT
jgi:hypothetical protein